MYHWNAVFELGDTEGVVSVDEHFDNGLMRLQATAKTAYSTSQDRDVVPRIGVDPFDSKGAVFVVNVSHVLAGINHIDIAQIAVGAIFQRRRCGVGNALNALRRFCIF
ncbi:MAG: hypothetical protein FWC27_05650 [Firmicutes bacterium]|nr:hypothetical protein [Bacillota bacterium]